MWAALATFLVALAAGGAKWWMEAHNLLEYVDPSSGEWTRTALGVEVHSHLRRVMRVSFVLTLWTLIDRLWLPWLKIADVAMGENGWHGVAPAVRAGIIFGWFLALSAVFLSFSLGI